MFLIKGMTLCRLCRLPYRLGSLFLPDYFENQIQPSFCHFLLRSGGLYQFLLNVDHTTLYQILNYFLTKTLVFYIMHKKQNDIVNYF